MPAFGSSPPAAAAGLNTTGLPPPSPTPLASSTSTTPTADPALVASVKMVASALHDPACGLAVTKTKQNRKQNILNKIKKARKFKGKPPSSLLSLLAFVLLRFSLPRALAFSVARVSVWDRA
jgi:hypothetical protein